MNRRTFLRVLAGTAPVIAVAPTYFFAPKGGWPAAEEARAKGVIGRWMLDQVGNERFDYVHPYHYEIAQKLKFDGMLWVPETEDPCAATYEGIERMSESKGLTA